MRALEDGWVAANGEPPPFEWINKVQYRSGDIATAECRSHVLDWKHDPWCPMVDIVAYLPERSAPENHETQCVRCGAPLWPNEPCPVCMNALATGAQQSSDNSLQLTERQFVTELDKRIRYFDLIVAARKARVEAYSRTGRSDAQPHQIPANITDREVEQ